MAWFLAVFSAGCSTADVSSGPAVAAAQSKGDGRIALGSVPRTARTRDAYVLLSGGGTPLSNNYSQYLQARGVAAFLEQECPPDATWIFFGAGNRPDAAPVLADVRREEKQAIGVVQSWLPGTLARNRPATKASFLRALREEILPTVRGGGTLYLFVGDHGELTGKGDKEESAITLWQLKRSRRGTWSSDDNEILSVTELRQALAAGLGEGQVVFCMTQCHSGGFHNLGLARPPAPPRSWFMSAPDWAVDNRVAVRLRIAGFTATDQESPAAGCVADPDPERWAGYERFFPEKWLGIDLMADAVRGSRLPSFATAHESATLVDRTIDKPRATSEHYLESWASVIETKLATTLNVTLQTQRAVAAYQRAVDHGTAPASDPALRERQEQFARFTQQLVVDVPRAKALFLTGTLRELQAAIEPPVERRGGAERPRRSRRGAMAEARKHWTETLRPAWQEAVTRGTVAELGVAALAFEKHLLALEDKGKDFLLPRDSLLLMDEIYWNSGYAEPAQLDRAQAEEVARWGAARRARIVAWGLRASAAEVRAAAEKIGPGGAVIPDEAPALTVQTAAERVRFYRRVLAAWELLIAMDARAPLAELQALIEIERTPLRPR